MNLAFLETTETTIPKGARRMNKLMRTMGVALAGAALCGATNETAKCGAAETTAPKGAATTQKADAQTQADAKKAQEAANRALIEGLLKKAELKYTVDDDGDYKLVFEVSDCTRKQAMWIETDIREVGGYRVLKLWSAAYRGTLTKPMAMELLADDYKVGFWGVAQKAGEDSIVLFIAKVPASISPEDLKTCCEAVIEAADRLERKWSDSDSL